MQTKLGQVAQQIQIGRLLTMHAAWKLDRGERARKEISMAKVQVTDTLHLAGQGTPLTNLRRPFKPLPRHAVPRAASPTVAPRSAGAAPVLRRAHPFVHARPAPRRVVFTRAPHRVHHRGAWRRLTAVGALPVLFLGGLAYQPHAYVLADGPACIAAHAKAANWR